MTDDELFKEVVRELRELTEWAELWDKMRKRHPDNEQHHDRIRSRELLACRITEARATLAKVDAHSDEEM